MKVLPRMAMRTRVGRNEVSRLSVDTLRPACLRSRYFSLGSIITIMAISIMSLSGAPIASASLVPPSNLANAARQVPAVKTRQVVVFVCAGNAPGVTISYGDDSSNLSAPRTPFSATLPLSHGAMYYDVNAQLDGSGSVSCSVTVHWNQGGRSHTARKVGTASGGYNIADPEVCSNFTGGWSAC
jgi:hypothetical protein